MQTLLVTTAKAGPSAGERRPRSGVLNPAFTTRFSLGLPLASLVVFPRLMALALALVFAQDGASAATFTNSMMQGQDPTVVHKDGYFHLVQSDGCRIRLRRASTLGGLSAAQNQVIYNPGCYDIWAPEIHWSSNRWYLYYTMNTNMDTGGVDRRGFVAESQGSNPYGPYVSRGAIFQNYWNIDGNVFTWNGKLYYLFSGEPVSGAQNIYIAPMSNPYTLSGTPVLISAPLETWERVGTPKVNEGPWGFSRDGNLFIAYSASGCWTDSYALGLLLLTGADPLNPASWTKSGPVFTSKPGAYGPGHNSLVQDPSGQWWNVYHANVNSGEGCGGLRRVRAQRVYWPPYTLPDFGSPVPNGSIINDNPDFLASHFQLRETSGTNAANAACAYSGTVMGSVAWAAPGLRFDGSSTYVDGGPAVGNDVQHQVTLSAWIKPEAFTDWAGIITKGITTAPYAMQIWSDGSLRFSANWGSPEGGIGSGSWNSTRKLALNKWQHVAVTYDGRNVRFYVDGVLDSYQPQVALRFGVVNESLTLGADFPGGDEYFKGTIKNAKVYGRALKMEEFFPRVGAPAKSGSLFSFDVNCDPGLDYSILNSTNARDWETLYSTNPSSVPFRISVPVTPAEDTIQMYRIRVQ